LVLTLGDGCENADSNPEFRYALCSQTDLIVKAPLHVTGSVAVDRTASLSSDVAIEGDLRYGSLLYETGTKEAAVRSSVQSTTTCQLPSSLSLDVAASVQARAKDNDNDQASEELAQLARWNGEQSITLPCGRYYLSEIDGDGSMTVNAMGNIVLFVDGSVSAKQGLQIRAAPSARVSLIVNGSVHVIGDLSLGELSDARHLLLAANQIHLEQGKNTIGGVLYAQSEDVLLVNGTLDVNGAVFAHRAQLEGATNVVHAPAAASAAKGCQAER
jgi:cytoskeletal protein CcmA (bactofilin family)